MSTATEEQRALDQITDRVRSRFPDAQPERVRSVVFEIHHQYDGSSIREFVPVLVEREAAETLSKDR